MAIKRIASHWRDTGRVPKFFIIDARSTFPLLIFLVHIRMWTFIVAVITTAIFGAIEHFGFTTQKFVRILRTYAAGRIKLSKPWWRLERPR